MSLEERSKATAKDVEGKAQEAVGNMTGSAADRQAGKAKQGEAEMRHDAEDTKEKVADAFEGAKERVKAAATNIGGKFDEAVGNATDDPAKVAQGKAKQAEADVRNAKEDLR
jgi:uncharacterized protein YjbJ (UPF0337 family)